MTRQQSKVASACCVAAFAALLSVQCGGARYDYKRPPTVDPASLELAALSLEREESSPICPGSQFFVYVTLVDEGGTTWRSGKRGGRVPVEKLKWEVVGGTRSGTEITVPDTLEPESEPSVLIRVASPAQPELVSELSLPVGFSCAHVVDYSCPNAGTADTGETGGDSVVEDQSVVSQLIFGESATDASPGSHGIPGEQGCTGPAVDVQVRVHKGNILAVSATAPDGRKKRVFVDAAGGTITIKANGGNGGDGGVGGDGGSGITKSEDDPDGAGGRGGNGGDGGDGGPGGTIEATFWPGADTFRSSILFENKGGLPGVRGLPGRGGPGSPKGGDGTAGRSGQAGPAGAPPTVTVKPPEP